VDRRILFKRGKTTQPLKISDLLLAINKAIKDQGLPEYIRLLRLYETLTGAISRLLKERASVDILDFAKTAILEIIQKIDSLIILF
jgi:hypothetical protein